MSRITERFKNINASDFAIIILVVILVIFGVVMVFSASYYKSINETGSPYGYLRKQVLLALAGAVILYVASIIDYHIWRKVAWPLLAGSLVLLCLLFTSLGQNVGGATRWIYLGPIHIMPGEVAKVAIIVAVATWLSDRPDRILSFVRGILPLAFVMALFAGLIMLQPNLSTALTVCGIIFGMAFLAGMKWRYVIASMFILAGGLYGISKTGTFWAKRITSFLDPFADPQGDGFQAVQSLLALGTGGLFGLGLGKSVQKTLYLPEPQNDFILAIIGEELGYVGILFLMIIFLILIWRCFLVSMNAKDQFGMLLAGGITLMIGIQVVLNIAVVTSSMPATGVAMPFISYGGNSLWIFMGAIGVLLNVSRQGHSLAPEPEQKESRVQKVRRKNAAEKLV